MPLFVGRAEGLEERRVVLAGFVQHARVQGGSAQIVGGCNGMNVPG